MGRVRESGSQQVLQLLGLFCKKQKYTFMEFREALGLAAPTLSRHLRTAQDAGWVKHLASGEYVPGELMYHLSSSLGQTVSAIEQAKLVVKELAARTGESAAFVQWEKSAFVFRAKHEMPDSYHYLEIGERNAGIFRHAFGLLALSYQPAAIRKRIIAEQDFSQKQVEEIEQQLESAETDGFLCGQDKGIRIGATVFRNGSFCGVLGISLLPQELTESRRGQLVTMVKSAAFELSKKISAV